jgi:hypothetical protein
MKRQRQIRPEALIELREAAEWYEEQREGLGGDLIDEFEQTLEDALGRLKTSAAIAKTAGGLPIRRFRLERFSRYAIYIVIFDDLPVVVAFEHASRKPGYWRDRVK